METRSNHVLVGAVVLILLAIVAIFTVWIARVSGGAEREYDIFFRQSVDGLAKGSTVTFSGVPSGQVKTISLWKPDPQYVRVRISVNDDTPILRGTTATIQGSFTGTSTVSLDGAIKGQAPITCPAGDARSVCPLGVPVIPTKTGGIGAILNSAPQLLERLSTLTERLTGMLSDRNQASIAGILDNTNRLTDALADRGPEIAATLAQTRVAIAQAGDAAQQIGELAKTTNGVMTEDVKPTLANLNATIKSARESTDTLNAAIGDARPGLTTFSKQTVPQINQLVRDLRVTAASLSAISERVEQGGASSLIGQQKLPEYKGN
ncbi:MULTISPECIES: MlaD family protein [Sphingomonas]|jgi:phospholipid/cholesterol/gamma-HCH transport system substrate-binding protein|uniref:MCE family protein n=1 Tax=Sphingomonas ginsenosidimutans TaxID=862134 RepID=A0A2A4HYJ4_9SPHN|nr:MULTISPECIES: MlaD family protein [Sphingomonas]MBY0301937.1 MlaD family protein [Sphingomonas ginsenosidimutans]PCG09952.1 MCE family protein [Sphingomonas ginsenosidimutans]